MYKRLLFRYLRFIYSVFFLHMAINIQQNYERNFKFNKSRDLQYVH